MNETPGLVPAAVVAKALPWAIVLAAVVLAFLGFRQSERRIGAANAIIAMQRDSLKQLDKVLPRQRDSVTTQTKIVVQRITKLDTVIQHIVDSAVKVHVDTVRIAVSVLTAAETTLRACRATLLECGKLASDERSRGDVLARQVQLLKAQQPSAAGGLLRGLLWGAAGYGLGRISR